MTFTSQAGLQRDGEPFRRHIGIQRAAERREHQILRLHFRQHRRGGGIARLDGRFAILADHMPRLALDVQRGFAVGQQTGGGSQAESGQQHAVEMIDAILHGGLQRGVFTERADRPQAGRLIGRDGQTQAIRAGRAQIRGAGVGGERIIVQRQTAALKRAPLSARRIEQRSVPECQARRGFAQRAVGDCEKQNPMTYKQETIKPYGEQGDKGWQVEHMFDRIAHSYDLLNHCLSLGIDHRWRRAAIDSLRPFAPRCILDVATGTGDFAIMAAKRLKPRSLLGVDISEGMLKVGRKKVLRADLADVVTFQREDCMALGLADNTFDALTVAYGIRNYEDLDRGLGEMLRVLKPGGRLVIIELTAPRRAPMKQLFWLYSHVLMPLVGRLISRDRHAYSYLPATMEAFPQGEEMQGILRKAGFAEVQFRRFTFGLSTLYTACKPKKP